MADAKTEIAQLRAENKRLKALLKNAVRLLHQSKQFLQHPAEPVKAKRKKTVNRRGTAASGRNAARA